MSKDQSLTIENYKEINGTFYNRTKDSLPSELYSLWQKLFAKSKHIDNWKNAKIKLTVSNPETLTATLIIGDKPIETRTTPFKLTKGYLNLKRQVNAKMFAGPLFWGITDFKIYLGLTTDNKLILINSNGGTAMILFIPTFASGGQFNINYDRIE